MFFFCTAVRRLSWHTNAIINTAVSLERGLGGAASQEESVLLQLPLQLSQVPLRPQRSLRSPAFLTFISPSGCYVSKG